MALFTPLLGAISAPLLLPTFPERSNFRLPCCSAVLVRFLLRCCDVAAMELTSDTLKLFTGTRHLSADWTLDPTSHSLALLRSQ